MALGFWNEERVNILTVNWKTHSAAEIAMAIGTSRNAVIGKGHRLKLGAKRPRLLPGTHRDRYVAKRAKKRRERREAAKAPPKPVEPIQPPQPVEGGVSIMDLHDGHCRGIVGLGPDNLARYCGAQKEGRIRTRAGYMQSAYCIAHGHLYYNRDY